MEIKNSYPPKHIYDRAQEKFGVDMEWGVVFTYGENIYSLVPLSEDLIAHESVHVKQQTEMGKDEWWDKYFEDKDFRYEQELEAYRVQYRFALKNYSREKSGEVLRNCAQHLSGSMYGYLVSRTEAQKAIRCG